MRILIVSDTHKAHGNLEKRQITSRRWPAARYIW